MKTEDIDFEELIDYIDNLWEVNQWACLSRFNVLKAHDNTALAYMLVKCWKEIIPQSDAVEAAGIIVSMKNWNDRFNIVRMRG